MEPFIESVCPMAGPGSDGGLTPTSIVARNWRSWATWHVRNGLSCCASNSLLFSSGMVETPTLARDLSRSSHENRLPPPQVGGQELKGATSKPQLEAGGGPVRLSSKTVRMTYELCERLNLSMPAVAAQGPELSLLQIAKK